MSGNIGGATLTSSGRKMRRTREGATASTDNASNSIDNAGGNSSNLWSGYDLYRIQGDAACALEIFQKDGNSSQSMAAKYNTLLLKCLKTNGDFTDLRNLEAEILSPKKKQLVSPRKMKRNEYITAYNRALVLFSKGRMNAAAEICSEKISTMIFNKQKPTSDEISVVTSRMALLLLECILTLAVGRHPGLSHITKTITDNVPNVDDIIDWIELLNLEKDPQLKFLLPVIKSRISLAQHENGKHVDHHIRVARKDMKTAMEVFQHKLRPSFGAETGSVVSSANSEENMSGRNNNHEQQSPPGSVILQKMNQSALGLKAHLEQLKGNTKKSLILCSEAHTATTSPQPNYDAVHSNNLAVVYETNNRRHLALYSLAKSMRAIEEAQLFHPDGTAQQDPSLSILHNAAICALRARKFTCAYECMSACIVRSPIFAHRARCWLRLAEACIGIFTDLRRKNNLPKYATVHDKEGNPQGIVIDNAMFTDDVSVVREELVTNLGNSDDLAQVQRNPLLRARAALEFVLTDSSDDTLEPDALRSARLSLTYIYLAFHDYREALDLAKRVLNDLESTSEVTSDSATATARLKRRQIATARMYAAEASCALGAMNDSMTYLVGDGKEDAFDRLAYDLSGVNLETASSNDQGKRRLAKAQTMVRSSACAVTAAMGNPAAKQLANSANAMEDAYSANRERSSARRALLYTLLREGNQSSALTMLLSLR